MSTVQRFVKAWCAVGSSESAAGGLVIHAGPPFGWVRGEAPGPRTVVHACQTSSRPVWTDNHALIGSHTMFCGSRSRMYNNTPMAPRATTLQQTRISDTRTPKNNDIRPCELKAAGHSAWKCLGVLMGVGGGCAPARSTTGRCTGLPYTAPLLPFACPDLAFTPSRTTANPRAALQSRQTLMNPRKPPTHRCPWGTMAPPADYHSPFLATEGF